MARRYAREAATETERDVVVFYIDNHLRPTRAKRRSVRDGGCRTSACDRV
jgi:hypothetical protein